jgi:ubiquitin carboxyl-terminal hydrolase L5
MSWTTIESDPGVFSELISTFGVKGVECREVWSLDQEGMDLGEISHGLIFLFKHISSRDERPVIEPVDLPDLFFAQQVVQNACATQAILSVLLNANGIELGENLEQFKEFAVQLDAETKGMAIGESPTIRDAHNSFARPEPFIGDETVRTATDKDDVFHFVAYVPHNGRVYELDGLKRGPILLGECSSDTDWRSIAKPAIESRMSSIGGEKYAILTISKSNSAFLHEELAAAEARDDDDTIGEISMRILDENSRLEKQRDENTRRKTNYVPLIIQLLQTLASKGKLDSMVTAALERAATTNRREADK